MLRNFGDVQPLVIDKEKGLNNGIYIYTVCIYIYIICTTVYKNICVCASHINPYSCLCIMVETVACLYAYNLLCIYRKSVIQMTQMCCSIQLYSVSSVGSGHTTLLSFMASTSSSLWCISAFWRPLLSLCPTLRLASVRETVANTIIVKLLWMPYNTTTCILLGEWEWAILVVSVANFCHCISG